jgi:hypothetical protein
MAPLSSMRARVPFEVVDPIATDEAKRLARNSAMCYYRHSPTLLQNLRQALRDRVFEIRSREYEEQQQLIWEEFFSPPVGQDESSASSETFERFRAALARDEKLTSLERALENAFQDLERTGLLASLDHEFGDGNMEKIMVWRETHADAIEINVSDVRIDEVRDKLHRRLTDELIQQREVISDPEFVSDRLFQWLSPKLPITLNWDRALTRRQADWMISQLPPKYKRYQAGDPLEKFDEQAIDSERLIARQPLTIADIALLRSEYQAFVESLSIGAKFAHSLAFFGMLAAALGLLIAYLNHRERPILDSLWRVATLLGLFVCSISAAWLLALDVESRA